VKIFFDTEPLTLAYFCKFFDSYILKDKDNLDYVLILIKN